MRVKTINEYNFNALIIISVVFFVCSCLVSCGSSNITKQRNKNFTNHPTIADTLSPQQQNQFKYFYLEALRQKAKKNYSAAFEMLRHCLKINPNSASAAFEIGQYYLTLGKTIPCVQAFKAAATLAPDNYWYNQALANVYQQLNDSTNSIATLEQMTQRFPTRKDPLLMLGDLYSQQENFPKVISTLDRIEKLSGKSEEISMEKFRIYVQMNDSTKAFKEMENLTKEYPLDNRYKVVLGDLYLQSNKKKEATDIYKKVLADEPDNAMALYSMANYYKLDGQNDKYEQQLDAILLNNKVPSDTKVEVMKQLIAQFEGENKDSTEIIRRFDKIIKQDPEDAQIPMLYANYLIAKGLNEQSLPVLRHIVTLDPSNVAARLMLLSSAIKKEDYKEVIQICEPGIEATPNSLELYFYLGIAYNQANRIDDALAVSKRALTHVTSDSKKEVVSDFYAFIGDLQHTKLKNKEAYAAYDSALVYNPDNIGALNNYAYYLSEENQQLDKAEEMSYKTVKTEPNNATYLDTYAWILFIKGKYTQARIYIDNAMKNGGGSSDVVTEHCGDIHAMSGDMEGALKYWRKAVELGNKSKVLRQKIEKKKYIK